MCGRAACTLNPHDLRHAASKALGRSIAPPHPPAGTGAAPPPLGSTTATTAAPETGCSYNMPPGSNHHVVHSQVSSEGCEGADDATDLQMSQAMWGARVAPGSSKLVINARSEALMEKATFRKMQACLVYISGYYEWCPTEERQPYYFHPEAPPTPETAAENEGPGGAPDCPPLLCCAGIYDPKKEAFLILTRSATQELSWCHHRVPVIFEGASDAQAWLGLGVLGSNPALALKLLEAAMAKKSYDNVRWHRVSREVGRIAFNSPDCVQRVEASAPLAKKRKTSSKSAPPPPGQPSLFDAWKTAPLKKRQRVAGVEAASATGASPVGCGGGGGGGGDGKKPAPEVIDLSEGATVV